MTDIYKQHDAAFKNVSAFVIMEKGERVATIAFKFPKDGAGRLYAYVHWIGVEMVRGHANGYGYDKKSAACYSAAILYRRVLEQNYSQGLDDFSRALAVDDGYYWNNHLENAGFTILQAV